MAIHIGIIDKDPTRLITALLHQHFKADKMIFIGIECQRDNYQKLKYVLNEKGIECAFFLIPSHVNIKAIKARICTLIETIKLETENIFFNASCGSRHRLLAIYEVFRSYHYPIYTIEPFSDELCWIYPDGKPNEQVEDHISIKDCLTIFGARSELADEHISLMCEEVVNILGAKWASNAHALGPGLATLNYLATKCRKEQRLNVELSEKQQTYQELAILIEDLKAAGLAQYQKGQLTFKNEAARQFANGEWLEWYVYQKVKSIQDELVTIQDLAINVQVFRKLNEKEVKNELDVVTVVNNKLHLIECKTKGMSNDGDDTLYKLESIRDLLGGIQARAMLVSFRPLRHHDVTRASDLGLALIGPDQLGELHTHLYQWFLEAGGK